MSKQSRIIMAAAFILSACTKVQTEGSQATGYMEVPSFETSLALDEFSPTKASPSLPVLSAPDESDIHFKVTDAKGVTVWDAYGLWTSPLKMAVGSYSIEAVSGSNTFGMPYFTGKCTGEINPGSTQKPELRLSLSNAALAISLSDDFSKHFICTDIEISSDSESITAVIGEYVFVPASEALTVTVKGSSSAGEPKTIRHRVAGLEAKTALHIECGLDSANMPSIHMDEIAQENAWGTKAYIPAATTANISQENAAKLKYCASADGWTTWTEASTENPDTPLFTGLIPGKTYSVRAEIGALHSNQVQMTTSTSGLEVASQPQHTFSDGELDGTDFAASFIANEKFKSDITAVTFRLCMADGTLLRTEKAEDGTMNWTSDGSALSEGWPLLPEGDYSVAGEAVMDGVAVELSPVQMHVGTLPDFKVSVNGTTTYDLYLAGNISEANSTDAATIKNITATVSGISEKLMMNVNYSFGISYSVDGTAVEAKSDNPYSANDATALLWGERSLKATATFAGKSVDSPARVCHITGLPYKMQEQNNPEGWILSNNGNCSGLLTLQRGEASALTCKFHMPGQVNISVDLLAYAYGGSIYSSYKPTVSIIASETAKKGTTLKTFSGSNQLPVTASYSNIKTDLSLDSSVGRICIYTSGKGSSISTGVGNAMGVVCKSLVVEYR